MTAETVLTNTQIFDCFDDLLVEAVIEFDDDELYSVGRAIEQAVLQSPEVQKLYNLLKEARQQLPLAAACWNEDENRDVADANSKRVLGLIARIDAAMENQP